MWIYICKVVLEFCVGKSYLFYYVIKSFRLFIQITFSICQLVRWPKYLFNLNRVIEIRMNSFSIVWTIPFRWFCAYAFKIYIRVYVKFNGHAILLYFEILCYHPFFTKVIKWCIAHFDTFLLPLFHHSSTMTTCGIL